MSQALCLTLFYVIADRAHSIYPQKCACPLPRFVEGCSGGSFERGEPSADTLKSETPGILGVKETKGRTRGRISQ